MTLVCYSLGAALVIAAAYIVSAATLYFTGLAARFDIMTGLGIIMQNLS